MSRDENGQEDSLPELLTPTEITAWCSVVRLALQLGGKEAAMEAWEQSPLPKIKSFYEDGGS